MDPDLVPLPSSCPPLGDEGDGELGSEDEEFGDFGGFSCSSLGSADPPASLKPATPPASCSFRRAVEQSQPTSTVNLESDRSQTDVGGQDRSADASLHLTNGFSGRRRGSGADGAAAVGAPSPEEETGFADFTVFGQQAAHPWCCGFSPPSGSNEPWDGRAGGTDLRPAGRDAVMESEPRSHCAQEAQNSRHAARALTSQDQRQQPQDAAAAWSPAAGEEELQDAEREQRSGLSSPHVSGGGDGGDPGVLQRPALSQSASEDPASFTDDLSFEGVSADLEPNVSSLDQTDWDPTDDEEEEPDLSDSRTGKLSRPESERALHQRDQLATQETRATSNQARPGAQEQHSSADGGSELHRDQEVLQAADAGVQVLGNLPPSDSFADFCSAPTQDDGPPWAEFKDQREEGKAWNQIREPVSRLQEEEEEQEEEQEEGQQGGSRRNSCQASLSCRVQQLLQTSFPEVMVAAVEAEELLDLQALLQTPRLSEEDQAPGLSGALWLQQEMLSPHRDVHSAVGLQFQWGGSHTNRTLLRCLGVDTRNIVFVGSRKQPVAVPAFASGLGMLEPTKDSVGSPGRSVVSAAAPPDQPQPSTHSAQEELPSSRPAWSSRGLSSSQDGTSPRRAPHFWGRK